MMNEIAMPENGAVVRFRRNDDDKEWKQGEYDQQNHIFIEIYAAEPVTHNCTDIIEWEYMEI